jgi:hypothetical protein
MTTIFEQLESEMELNLGGEISDAEFEQAATEAVKMAAPFPATPDLYDGLRAAIDDAPEPRTVWDWLEENIRGVQVYLCILALIGMIAVPAYLWLVNA